MALITRILGIALAGSLAACGPLGEGATSSTLRSAAGSLLGSIDGGDDTAQAPAPAPTALTRADIEAAGADLLLVSLVSRGSVDILSQFSARPGTVTWISTDGVSVTLSDGMIVATRGSGFDLMGADTRAARRSLSAGGTHSRAFDFLTGLDQIETEVYSCTTEFDEAEVITIVERDYATQKWREECSNGQIRFTNLYWTTSDDVIMQSRQYVSLGLGYLVYQRL